MVWDGAALHDEADAVEQLLHSSPVEQHRRATTDCLSSALATIDCDTAALQHDGQAIEDFLSGRLESLLGQAERLIDRYRVVDPAVGPEDLVQSVFLKLWRGVMNGKLRWLEADARMTKLVWVTLCQEALDERNRELRRKRGGSGVSREHKLSAPHRVNAELEEIASKASPAEEELVAEDETGWLLDRLDDCDPSLRAVAALVAQALTHPEIAVLLGQSLWSVEEKHRRIKAILGPLFEH
jgi:DNA-directed RNA polymerase specialized sigma24 family protein